ncbi:MAG: efflux RND transporter permease subunit [Myxococcota bacterium]|jgi:HAE1 family hydrophobic/amphiphilic exporter-1|nr:efflux RND transporter permease subunit [Myxococcota bacterium]
MNLSSFSVRRGVTVSMLYLIIAGFGLFSLTQLKLDLFPDLNFPMVLILTSYTGANPDDIETLVTTPLEGAVISVEGIEEVSSDSKEGASVIMAKFAWGSDMNQAETDVRRTVDMVKGILPEDADSPLIFALDPSMQPVIMMMVTGPYPLDKLRDIADNDIKPRLERIEGVASAEAAGGLERQIRIELEPKKLESNNLDVSTILNVVYQENVKPAGGSLTHGRIDYAIDPQSKYQTVKEIQDVVVGARVTSSGPEPIRLGEVATVVDDFAEMTRYLEVDGQPTVWMMVRKQSDANTAETANAVMADLDAIRDELGGQLQFNVIFNQADIINDSMSNLSQSAIIGIIITFFVLLLMLRNFRASILVATAIPLSVIATFSVMYIRDMTLNVISMAGLALAIGMLVDNAIIVLENIYRLREEGLSLREAASQGGAQVSLAVTASTLTTVAVFFPVLFVPGIAGMLFRDMAITICFSLSVSLLVSLSFIPLGASRILGKIKPVDPNKRRGPFALLQAAYGAILDWTLAHRWVVGLGVLGTVAATVLLYLALPTEFLMTTDESRLQLSVEAPVGSSLDETYALMKEVADVLREIVPEEERKMVTVDVGTGEGFVSIFSKGAHAGTIRAPLVKPGHRQRSQLLIENDLREALKEIPGVKVTVGNQTSITGSQGDMEVQIRGHDLKLSRKIGLDLSDQIAALPEIAEVTFSMEEQKPQIRVIFDRAKMAELGLMTSAVSRAISAYFKGTLVGRFSEGGDEYDIIVRYTKDFRSSIEDLRQMPVRTQAGAVVRLSRFAEVKEDLGPVAISRLDQERVTRLFCTLKPTYVDENGVEQQKDLNKAIEKVRAITDAYDWPEHFSGKVGGAAEEFQTSFMYLGLALILSVVLVYMVMASQFESFRQPFIILFTVPLAGIGVVVMFSLTRDPMDIASLVGLIMLVGIVVNNGIVLVDAANQIRQETGKDRIPAVALAARMRFRPVLLTSMTTIFGMVPLALKLGEGAETWAGLARSVIGGLISASFLTLFVVPTVYSLFAPKKIKDLKISTPSQAELEAPSEAGMESAGPAS